ncbi:flagellar hook-length control protein FliK [Oscillibacter sp.]|uniref:flagellar hook-length control protein FliK n=1 Tax=Oscillibacter sp. TaxID=1945593 RepID=UPI0028ACF5FF|nr:flagellar hook-length control protein FliK [Oscillibacter sp.]
MMMTNELLQMAQIYAQTRTQKINVTDGTQISKDSGSDFEKLMRNRTDAGRTNTAAQPGSGKSEEKQTQDPQDKTLQDVTAAMAMLMSQAQLPQVQTEALLPEEVQTQVVAPAVLQMGEETALENGPVQTGLLNEGGLTSKQENSLGQETAALHTARTPDAGQDGNLFQGTQSTQAAQTSQTTQTLSSENTGARSGAQTQSEYADLLRSSQSNEALQPENVGVGAPQPLFREMDAIPVKVGEPVVDTIRTDVDEQLAAQVGKALKDGAQQVKLRLTPDRLGTLTIDLTRTQDGALQVVFHTTTEKAADLLSRHADSLSALLQSNNQSTVQVQVRQQEEAQQYQQQSQQQGRQQEHSRRQQDQRRQSGEDFLQQLRLGLVTLDGQVS